MMEAARTSETSVDIQLITWQYIQKILSFTTETKLGAGPADVSRSRQDRQILYIVAVVV
jgi:hypothetical protein